jgi:hypothetical protein
MSANLQPANKLSDNITRRFSTANTKKSTCITYLASSVHILSTYFLKIHFNIIPLHVMSICHFPRDFPTKIMYQQFSLGNFIFHARRMLCVT